MFNPLKQPPEPSYDVEETKAALTQGMFDIRESLTPVFDMADGMRADLEKRGWSPTAAESASLVWLQRTLMNCTPLVGGQP
ncbi:hypothetical protein ACIA7S_28530 [Streptomyces sp. NPDC051643]|uniref:hypothetical protein n=1 Tax=Streptomyces sp. NPDC051643 TaxID=3365665 RepID=UPI0037A7B26A